MFVSIIDGWLVYDEKCSIAERLSEKFIVWVFSLCRETIENAHVYQISHKSRQKEERTTIKRAKQEMHKNGVKTGWQEGFSQVHWKWRQVRRKIMKPIHDCKKKIIRKMVAATFYELSIAIY